jgi:hypothetical protein
MSRQYLTDSFPTLERLWTVGQLVYVNSGPLEDFPVIFEGMASRRRARVVVGLFGEARASIDVEHLEQ